MTLFEFIMNYSGKYVNFDDVYGPQCMDLYRQYAKEVLTYPQSVGVSTAADVWEKYLESHYDRIAKVEANYPVLGDIAIWGYTYGPNGHIAIILDANENGMICFSQNDPIKTRAGLKVYPSYKHVLGWLHPKV